MPSLRRHIGSDRTVKLRVIPNGHQYGRVMFRYKLKSVNRFKNVRKACSRPTGKHPASGPLVEKPLRPLQVGGAEPFGEMVIDCGQQIGRLVDAILSACNWARLVAVRSPKDKAPPARQVERKQEIILCGGSV